MTTELTDDEVKMVLALARRLRPRSSRKTQAVRRTLLYIMKCGVVFCAAFVAVMKVCERLR